jgi:Holliday junction resolvase RusA-like endonuclease
MADFVAELPGTPPSLWSCYRIRPGGKGLYITPEGRTWKRDAIFAILRDPLPKPLRGRIAVDVSFFVHGRGNWDIDNKFKVLFDAMTEAGVWTDDSRIDSLVSRVFIVPKKDEVRTLVIVSEIEEALSYGG